MIDDLLGKPVIGSFGEPLGEVVRVEPDASGRPRKLRFRGAGEPERVVKIEFVRAVRRDRIELKGPREGFHMTRLAAGTEAAEG